MAGGFLFAFIGLCISYPLACLILRPRKHSDGEIVSDFSDSDSRLAALINAPRPPQDFEITSRRN